MVGDLVSVFKTMTTYVVKYNINSNAWEPIALNTVVLRRGSSLMIVDESSRVSFVAELSDDTESNWVIVMSQHGHVCVLHEWLGSF